jgi:tetratricopeptide (TPR) repeat protein
VGAWSSHSDFEFGTERTEFFKDGACFIESRGQRITGAWAALDDGRLRVTVTLGGGPALTMFATVNGDELVLDAGTNNRTAYVREQSQRASAIQANVQKNISEREIRIEAEKRAVAERQAAADREQERQREAERVAREQRRESDRIERQREQEARRATDAGKEAFKRGLYQEGITEYERAAKLGSALAMNELAWHYATCKDARQHNGKKAVELALQALQSEPDEEDWIDTLAAAYARVGDFDKAVSTMVRALSQGSVRGGEDRLKLYRQRKAYQETE